MLTNFEYSLPQDVDYIRAGSPNNNGTDLLKRRTSSQNNLPTNPVSGALSRLSVLFSQQGIPKGAIPVNQPSPSNLSKNSPTYGEWMNVELNEENKFIFYVPPGFAHGFLTLQDDTDFLYKVTTEYSPIHELGINPFDSKLNIPWKSWLDFEFILSKKDNESPLLHNFSTPFII